MRKLLSVMLIAVPIATAAQAKTSTCKISVVGGSWAGHSFPLKMQDGRFVGTSGVNSSRLPGCVAKKYVYGRWYHLCKGGKLVVFKHKSGRWQRLKAKSLKKYKHNCL